MEVSGPVPHERKVEDPWQQRRSIASPPRLASLPSTSWANDPNVAKTSEWYYGFLTAVLNRHPAIGKRTPPRYLEIACYRHILGYKLAKDRGFESTQFDICDRDLLLGRDIAVSLGLWIKRTYGEKFASRTREN